MAPRCPFRAALFNNHPIDDTALMAPPLTMYNNTRRCCIHFLLIVIVLFLLCTLGDSTPIRCHYGNDPETYCITDNKLGWCASYLVKFSDYRNVTFREVNTLSCDGRDLYEHPFWCDHVRNQGAYLKAGTCRQHTYTMPNNFTVVSGIYCCCQKEFCNAADAIHWHRTGYSSLANDSPTIKIGSTDESYSSSSSSATAEMIPELPTTTTTTIAPAIVTYELQRAITVSTTTTTTTMTTTTTTTSATSTTGLPSTTMTTPLLPSENGEDLPFPGISPSLLQAISNANNMITATTMFKSNGSIIQYPGIPFPLPGPLPIDPDDLLRTTNKLPPFTVPKSSRDLDAAARAKLTMWWLIGGATLMVLLFLLSAAFITLVCYWQQYLCFKPQFDIEHNPSYDSPPRVAKMLVTDITSCSISTPRVWFNDDHQPSSIGVSDIASIASSSGYTDRSLPPLTAFGTVKSML